MPPVTPSSADSLWPSPSLCSRLVVRSPGSSTCRPMTRYAPTPSASTGASPTAPCPATDRGRRTTSALSHLDGQRVRPVGAMARRRIGSFAAGSGNPKERAEAVGVKKAGIAVHQLPPRHARLPVPSCACLRARRPIGQLRAHGLAGRLALGAAQHRPVRRLCAVDGMTSLLRRHIALVEVPSRTPGTTRGHDHR